MLDHYFTYQLLIGHILPIWRHTTIGRMLPTEGSVWMRACRSYTFIHFDVSSSFFILYLNGIRILFHFFIIYLFGCCHIVRLSMFGHGARQSSERRYRHSIAHRTHAGTNRTPITDGCEQSEEERERTRWNSQELSIINENSNNNNEKKKWNIKYLKKNCKFRTTFVIIVRNLNRWSVHFGWCLRFPLHQMTVTVWEWLHP